MKILFYFPTVECFKCANEFPFNLWKSFFFIKPQVSQVRRDSQSILHQLCSLTISILFIVETSVQYEAHIGRKYS